VTEKSVLGNRFLRKKWGCMRAEVVNSKEKILITQKDLHKPVYEFMKRICDVLLSSIALIVLSPLFLATALAVKADGGSAFYAQMRVGKDNKPFKMYKFRSMCQNAEMLQDDLMKYNEMDGPVFKIREDPRITKVGKIIRKYSIDELPQLVNIIKGDMSIVGPRPPLANEVAQYNAYQMQRLLVKPGLTCFWQAYGRSNLSFEDWMEMDMKYIKRRSLWLDIGLIVKTVFAVIFKRGAY
jgi:lipopolysaccharide/colanic/teichoic acid biosynthesis glycosyltransferase